MDRYDVSEYCIFSILSGPVMPAISGSVACGPRSQRSPEVDSKPHGYLQQWKQLREMHPGRQGGSHGFRFSDRQRKVGYSFTFSSLRG